MEGATEVESDRDPRVKRAASAGTRKEVGLAPGTGAKVPDLVEVDGITKEVIGVVTKVAVVEAVAETPLVTLTTTPTWGRLADMAADPMKIRVAEEAEAAQEEETEEQADSIIEVAQEVATKAEISDVAAETDTATITVAACTTGDQITGTMAAMTEEVQGAAPTVAGTLLPDP